jgi:hypothetical protein
MAGVDRVVDLSPCGHDDIPPVTYRVSTLTP